MYFINIRQGDPNRPRRSRDRRDAVQKAYALIESKNVIEDGRAKIRYFASKRTGLDAKDHAELCSTLISLASYAEQLGRASVRGMLELGSHRTDAVEREIKAERDKFKQLEIEAISYLLIIVSDVQGYAVPSPFSDFILNATAAEYDEWLENAIEGSKKIEQSERNGMLTKIVKLAFEVQMDLGLNKDYYEEMISDYFPDPRELN